MANVDLTQHYHAFGHGSSALLLPSFRQVYSSSTLPIECMHALQQFRKPQTRSTGQATPWQLHGRALRALATWVVERLEEVLTIKLAHLSSISSPCCKPYKVKVQQVSYRVRSLEGEQWPTWLWDANYPCVLLGFREGGKSPVYERASRLALWLRAPYQHGSMVLHDYGGPTSTWSPCKGNWRCKSSLCVNPFHLKWGTATMNRRDGIRKAMRRELHDGQ